MWLICLLVITPHLLFLSPQFEGERAGHLGRDYIASTQQGFFSNLCFPPSPSPPFHFLLLTWQLHISPVPAYTCEWEHPVPLKPPLFPKSPMDQRTQGGPSTPPLLPANAPPVEREKEGVGGKKDDEEENKKREKPRDGTQSETCGAESGTSDQQQQPTQFSVKETSYSEGNVKLKIGLQAKRMKKPPKILENYICRPAFRATVRHSGGRGGGRVNRGARANDGSNHTSSPSCGKEREKSPSVSRGAPLSSSGPAAASPSPSLPPPVCTSSVTPVSGSAPAKRVRLFNFSPCIS